MAIHPSAILDPAASLGTDVEIGPNAIIGADVVVGDRCRIGPNACLIGPLVLGEECRVDFSVALGGDPQVQGDDGPFGSVRIGARSHFREFTTVHRSRTADGETVVGDDCFFMAGAHVAHDCVVGNNVVIVNQTVLGGHVSVGDRAFLGGITGVHQFVRIGELAMVAGLTTVTVDVPPFCMVAGARPARLQGLNVVGLRRAGIKREARAALKSAYKTLFRSSASIEERLASIEPTTEEVRVLVEFVREAERSVAGIGGPHRSE